MEIDLQTRVGALLDAYPALEQTFMELSPAFAKLRNPVLRRTVARVTTLQQAARIAGISPALMVQTLRRAAGLAGGSEDAHAGAGKDAENMNAGAGKDTAARRGGSAGDAENVNAGAGKDTAAIRGGSAGDSRVRPADGGIDVGGEPADKEMVVGGKPVDGEVSIMNRVGDDDSGDAPPVWFDADRITARYDATPVIEAGQSPMREIVRIAEDLGQGEILELSAPFKPVPIIDLLKSKGFSAWCADGKSYFIRE